VVVSIGGVTTIVDLSFPMIGRPSIVTPDATLGSLELVPGARPVSVAGWDLTAVSGGPPWT
jgi:hypothetical protein